MTLAQNGDFTVEGSFRVGENLPGGRDGLVAISAPWGKDSMLQMQHIHEDGDTDKHKKTQWSVASTHANDGYRWRITDDMGFKLHLVSEKERIRFR